MYTQGRYSAAQLYDSDRRLDCKSFACCGSQGSSTDVVQTADLCKPVPTVCMLTESTGACHVYVQHCCTHLAAPNKGLLTCA